MYIGIVFCLKYMIIWHLLHILLPFYLQMFRKTNTNSPLGIFTCLLLGFWLLMLALLCISPGAHSFLFVL